MTDMQCGRVLALGPQSECLDLADKSRTRPQIIMCPLTGAEQTFRDRALLSDQVKRGLISARRIQTLEYSDGYATAPNSLTASKAARTSGDGAMQMIRAASTTGSQFESGNRNLFHDCQ